jgi:two-component system OmpR family response regulator
MRVLIIENDPEVTPYLVKGLTESGYTVDHAPDGKDGLFMATNENYDVMVIDRMPPNIHGLTLIKNIRAASKQTPMLILCASGQVNEIKRTLREGVDDYLTKPFALSELLARLDALLHRTRKSAETETHFGVADLEIDFSTSAEKLTHLTKRSGKVIDLQPHEFRLLEYLMRYAGQVVTSSMLLENVWNYHIVPQTNVIDVHISRLRSKIDQNFSQPLLHTVHSAGYIIRENDQTD